ncbi:hypothetical protein LAV73_06710 [Lysinibacillus xylanilyticus]|uniref:hypothetical protein n=1 Tax=Lysinibacillus xylanilyticus TaxID=582475 RepID=UPI002B24FA08|nr:hypothetical protein [Lysinibacillus xylanilyticus]MEB2279691.1 hypothetical protein [Lysinibacillus xylanilyticus]
MYPYYYLQRQHLNPDIFDPNPTDPTTTQFFPGQRITAYLPNVPGGQITGTFIRFIPPSTAVIQSDTGQVLNVDINQITVASTAPLPNPPGSTPPDGSWRDRDWRDHRDHRDHRDWRDHRDHRDWRDHRGSLLYYGDSMLDYGEWLWY